MRPSSSIADHDQWTQATYEVRVRGTQKEPIYLWGSAGLKQDVSFDKPLILHIRNHLFGEIITFGTTQVAPGKTKTYGTLQPGECVSIPLQNISGVFAFASDLLSDTSNLESTVSCLIKGLA
jgi:hypothetical protein